MDDSGDLDGLVSAWTLLKGERALVDSKRAGSRLGFALLLKSFVAHGRFPAGADDFSAEVVEFVAGQLKADPTELEGYAWSGRSAERHRAEVRGFLGFRECSVADAERLTDWLAVEVCEAERDPAVVLGELSGRCVAESIEPPSALRAERVVRAALHRSEIRLTDRIAARLGRSVAGQLEALLADDDEVLRAVRQPPGNVSLTTLLSEISKLRAVRALGLPSGVFAGIAPKVVARWRAQAAVESPSHLRRHRPQLRLALLAALVQQREHEITDTLVDLFISTVHRIGASADRRVTQELVKAFKRVTGKENILFAIAEASLASPNAPVRQVVFPAVNGGEQTLRDLVAEFKTSGPEYRRTVQTTLRASYTGHYRRGLIELLDVLEFRSNNPRHRPVLDALEVVKRHAQGRRTYYPDGEVVPEHRWVLGEWQPLVFVAAADGSGARVVRAVYEICTFQALREQLRCKEIWVVGAERWRNPDEDLPADFESRRDEHYATLRKPLDPSAFIDELQAEMHAELTGLSDSAAGLPWLEVADRGGRGAIKLTPLEAQPEPKNLGRIKDLVAERWGTVALIDMLKEAILRTGCLDALTAGTRRGDMPRQDLAERLILALFAYGTNTGIRAIAGGRHSERDIRYVRGRYLTPDVARFIATEIANATFAAREQAVWGRGTTSVASDSTHFGSYDQNIFTEWHSRYGGRGVLIYWHVEKKSMAVHSQLISCSASEVAAMVDGAIRHGTTMDVQANYTDTHGQSEIGFGITRLLGFDLLPRIKRINHLRLYRPQSGPAGQYPGIEPAMTRAIRWELIEDQYDQMIRYATAIRSGTASTEAILRRFARANAMHPTYQAMIEVGRAQRTIFAARYLRSRDLQREIHEGLNVMESWNQANAVIFYGKGGDLASNRRDEQELSVLALRVLQAALVYVNTLMVQDVLASPGAPAMAAEDLRGLTPLFWTHVAPYGEVKLDLTDRLSLR